MGQDPRATIWAEEAIITASSNISSSSRFDAPGRTLCLLLPNRYHQSSLHLLFPFEKKFVSFLVPSETTLFLPPLEQLTFGIQALICSRFCLAAKRSLATLWRPCWLLMTGSVSLSYVSSTIFSSQRDPHARSGYGKSLRNGWKICKMCLVFGRAATFALPSKL